MTTPVPTVSAELKGVLRQVKLGRCLDTLPERLALADARMAAHAIEARLQRRGVGGGRRLQPGLHPVRIEVVEDRDGFPEGEIERL